MTVTGLVMAGGKGTRMAIDTEKPLLEIDGKPMILYVMDALRAAKKIDDIIVATSKYTQNTTELLRSLRIKVFETPGEGYVEDTQLVVKSLRLRKTLVVSADLPLVTGEFINEVINRYEISGKSALAVMYPESLKHKIDPGDETREQGETKLLPAGVNVLDGSRIYEKQLDEEVMVTHGLELTFNVNTTKDLKLAKSMIRSTQTNRRK